MLFIIATRRLRRPVQAITRARWNSCLLGFIGLTQISVGPVALTMIRREADVKMEVIQEIPAVARDTVKPTARASFTPRRTQITLLEFPLVVRIRTSIAAAVDALTSQRAVG
jgi:hypothetical protein